MKRIGQVKSCIVLFLAVSQFCRNTEAFPSIGDAFSSLLNGESTLTDLKRLNSLTTTTDKPSRPNNHVDQNLDGQSSVSVKSLSNIEDQLNLVRQQQLDSQLVSSGIIPAGKRRFDDADLAGSASGYQESSEKLNRRHQAEQQKLLRQYTELMRAQLMRGGNIDIDGNLDYNQRSPVKQANRRNSGSNQQQGGNAERKLRLRQEANRKSKGKKQQQASDRRSDSRGRANKSKLVGESRKKIQRPLVNRNSNSDEDNSIFKDEEEDDSNADSAQKQTQRRKSDDADEQDEVDDDEESEVSEQPQQRQQQRRKSRPVESASSRQRQRASSKNSRKSRGGRQNELSDKDSDEDSKADGDASDGSEEGDSTELKPYKTEAVESNETTEVVKGQPEGSESTSQVSKVNSGASDLQEAAGSHHGHHGHYYQHVEVPKKKTWKFGFKRGNHKHEIERHEKGHKHKFHSSFKWHAKEKCKKKKKCKSVGKMTWKYEHAKKKHH